MSKTNKTKNTIVAEAIQMDEVDKIMAKIDANQPVTAMEVILAKFSVNVMMTRLKEVDDKLQKQVDYKGIAGIEAELGVAPRIEISAASLKEPLVVEPVETKRMIYSFTPSFFLAGGQEGASAEAVAIYNKAVSAGFVRTVAVVDENKIKAEYENHTLDSALEAGFTHKTTVSNTLKNISTKSLAGKLKPLCNNLPEDVQ